MNYWKLFKPPFFYDDVMYIWDQNLNMVIIFERDKSPSVRGYGRLIQIFHYDEKEFDNYVSFMKKIIGNTKNPQVVVSKLNEAWKIE